jgi:hypothetical protein
MDTRSRWFDYGGILAHLSFGGADLRLEVL